uniref:Secreted protein n=1 Tax=Angiostrongylus cantonensis TaxID=6313 RepID=A0A0K0DDD7_ANGCA
MFTILSTLFATSSRFVTFQMTISEETMTVLRREANQPVFSVLKTSKKKTTKTAMTVFVSIANFVLTGTNPN